MYISIRSNHPRGNIHSFSSLWLSAYLMIRERQNPRRMLHILTLHNMLLFKRLCAAILVAGPFGSVLVQADCSSNFNEKQDK